MERPWICTIYHLDKMETRIIIYVNHTDRFNDAF